MHDPSSNPTRLSLGLPSARRARGGIAVERVDLRGRRARLRFVRAGELLRRGTANRGGPSLLAETFRLDPDRSPAMACTEALGLLAHSGGRLVGRMLVLRPAGGGEEGWFARLDAPGGPAVVQALSREGARWIARGGGRRWFGPVGLMPGDVCGVQVDGFVGQRAADLPRWAPGVAESVLDSGFTVAAETGFWRLAVPREAPERRIGCRIDTVDVDLAHPDAGADATWGGVLDHLPASTDPVSRLSCAPDRLRHELLRAAVPGGVMFATTEGRGVALGVMRPACSSVPGVALPGWMTRLRQWKRRAAAAEGHARMWTADTHLVDPLVASAVLDALVERARDIGYGRLLIGPVSVAAHGTIAALRDRGARIDCRFHVFAQSIDPMGLPQSGLSQSPRPPLTRQP